MQENMQEYARKVLLKFCVYNFIFFIYGFYIFQCRCIYRTFWHWIAFLCVILYGLDSDNLY